MKLCVGIIEVTFQTLFAGTVSVVELTESTWLKFKVCPELFSIPKNRKETIINGTILFISEFTESVGYIFEMQEGTSLRS